MTNINDYNTPTAGTTDWHVPLNENFGWIADDVSALAAELDTSVQADYNEPASGTTDWHVPLNENFSAIDEDVQTLAAAAGVSDVGGYGTPTEGSVDWHVPLNENFASIESDLSTIADAIGGDSPSERRRTLSAANVWYDVVDNYGTDEDTLIDVTTYSGDDLGAKFESAASDAMANGSRPVFFVPEGSYTWSTVVTFNTIDLNGPMILAHSNAIIDVTSEWAFDLSGYTGDLSPDVDTAFRLVGGVWQATHGVLRQANSFRGEFSPDKVDGGTYGMRLVASGDEFCEGWSYRDTVYDGVSRPIECESSSADQQFLSNLTFRDFDIGYNADVGEGSTTQNWTAINPRFEDPRSGAVGMKTGNYCTGSIYAPTWTDGSGVVFDFNDSGTNPSIVDPDVASGADLWTGQYGPIETSSGVDWQQAQHTDIVSSSGPSIPTPIVRSDEFDGSSAAERVENAVSSLSDGGTVLVPSGRKSWGSTLNVDLAGRDVRVVTTPNTRFDVSTSGWAIDVSGEGTFGVYGGDWRGSSGHTGFLRSTATNLDIAVKQIRDWGSGKAVVSNPATKGVTRIFDTKFHRFGDAVSIGGAGVSKFLITCVEFSYGHKCIQVDSQIDELQCVRVSSHTYEPGSVFADTNARIDSGAWHNVKFESFNESNQTVFDNDHTSTVAPVVEPVVYGGSDPVALWTGTEPDTFPRVNDQRSTKYEP